MELSSTRIAEIKSSLDPFLNEKGFLTVEGECKWFESQKAVILNGDRDMTVIVDGPGITLFEKLSNELEAYRYAQRRSKVGSLGTHEKSQTQGQEHSKAA